MSDTNRLEEFVSHFHEPAGEVRIPIGLRPTLLHTRLARLWRGMIPAPKIQPGRILLVLRALFWTGFILVMIPHLPRVDANSAPSLESLISITGHGGPAPAARGPMIAK